MLVWRKVVGSCGCWNWGPKKEAVVLRGNRKVSEQAAVRWWFSEIAQAAIRS